MILRDYDELHELLKRSGKILCIHGRSYDRFTKLKELIDSLGSRVIHFMDFSPNPKLDEAKRASEIECDVILTIGGGSAIDVSKYAKMNHPESKLIVIPTTAGSGSEATRYAVLYKDGKKLSVTDDNIIPNYVMFDTELLCHMPEYVKKSSALDAFSHALESFWSVNANSESEIHSNEALSMITRLLENYPESYDYEAMQRAAYIAGKAINITQTTAGHAMCYRITGMFGISHGHATALCNRVLFPYLVKHTNLDALKSIAVSMGCDSPDEAVKKYGHIYSRMNLEVPEASMNQIDELVSSVNPERLRNFPVKLTESMIRELYCNILKVKV